MSIPLTKRSPIWLAKQNENDPNLPPSYRRSIRYFKALYTAWPEWCSEHKGFKTIYTIAKIRKNNGENVHIDHVIPICSDIVCGLHVPWNLEVISSRENMSKSNRHWPDAPFKQLELNI